MGDVVRPRLGNRNLVRDYIRRASESVALQVTLLLRNGSARVLVGLAAMHPIGALVF